MRFAKRTMLGLAVIVTVGALSLASTSQAKAQCGSYGGRYVGSYGGHYGGSHGVPYGGNYGSRGRSYPVYHGPSVHYDRVYHPTRLHWTPNRGLHTHGHYDAVPHQTPGHFDRGHNGHVHGNPYFHH